VAFISILSTPVENSAFRRSKIPPPTGDEGLQIQPVGVKMKPAADAEAGRCEKIAPEYEGVQMGGNFPDSGLFCSAEKIWRSQMV
jgi:hypothetical protein